MIATASFLFLGLLPAFLRWTFRGGPRWWIHGGRPKWWRRGRPWWGQHRQATQPAHPDAWPHITHWTPPTSTAIRLRSPESGPAWEQSSHPNTRTSGPRSSRARAFPSFTAISLPAAPLPINSPVPLSWSTVGARSVSINGQPGYPPSGTANIAIDRSGQCSLIAEGPGRTFRHAWTMPVPMLEIPTPHIKLPESPGLSLQAQVNISDRLGTLLDTLHVITERRQAFLPTVETAVSPAVMTTRSEDPPQNFRRHWSPLQPTDPAASTPTNSSAARGES